jgi:hypothetical protein
MFFFLLLPTLSPHIPEVFLLANVISFAAVVRSPYRASGKDFGQTLCPKRRCFRGTSGGSLAAPNKSGARLEKPRPLPRKSPPLLIRQSVRPTGFQGVPVLIKSP